MDPNKILKLENEFFKKPRINSRAKGNRFERDLAKRLNSRFNTKDFSRTPGSGAFGSTHSLPKHLKIYGDLITPETSDLYSFIEQAKNDARSSEREWILIYKKDRQKAIVITEREFPTKEQIRIRKMYYVYLLEDFLSLPDEHFFEDTDDGLLN